MPSPSQMEIISSEEVGLVLEPNAEPIPGYRLIQFLGRGDYGEVWKCEAPGGFHKALKIIHGRIDGLDAQGEQAEQELNALQHVKSLRHPFLLSMDRVEVVEGQLLIVSELADRSLAEVFAEYQGLGMPGIPRKELLGYLGEAAEVLDWMSFEHGLQHLDVKPSNILVVANHIKVADFGLVCNLEETRIGEAPTDLCLTSSSPRFSAPETIQGLVSPYSDQYSLALLYMELLTGQFPFKGKNIRQLALQHAQEQPDLQALSAEDQPIVARALAKTPKNRFASCSEFIHALVSGSTSAALLSARDVTPAPTRIAADLRQAPSSGNQAAIPGYYFRDCLGRGPLGEIWEIQSAKGLRRLARLIINPGGSLGQRPEAAAFLEAPGHPALVPWQVICWRPDRVVLVADFAGVSLQDRFNRVQEQGQSGLPRAELLPLLRAVAGAVDGFTRCHQLRHLRLNPRSICPHEGGVRILDAGLVEVMGPLLNANFFLCNARYAAPELDKNLVGAGADVYSLAVIYHEMLTGLLPFRRQGHKQLLQARSKEKPELDLLPAGDRPAVANALDRSSKRRFATCSDFISALEAATPGALPSTPPPKATLAKVIPTSRAANGVVLCPESVSAEGFVADLVAASGMLEVHPLEDIRCQLLPGEMLLYRCGAHIIPDIARLKLAGFCQQWNGRIVASCRDLVVLQVESGGGWWQKLMGKPFGLKVELEMQRPQALAAQLMEIVIRVHPFGCSRAQADELLGRVGPVLLKSLREYFQPGPEQRQNERLVYPHRLQIIPVLADHQLGKAMDCEGKDVSSNGMGFVSLNQLPTPQIYVHPTFPASSPLTAVLGNVVRVHQRGDGRFEMGVSFDFQMPDQQSKH